MLVQCPGYVFVQYPGRYLMIDMPGFAGYEGPNRRGKTQVYNECGIRQVLKCNLIK